MWASIAPIRTLMYTERQMSTFLTVAESAEKAKVSERTILREIKRGNIVPKKVGRKYLISQQEFDRYLTSNADKSGTSLEEFFKHHKGDMTDLLQKIVSLPSVTSSTENESVLAEYLVKKLKKLGIRSSLVKEGQTVAVRASFGYADEGLLLDCPLDTTPAGDIEKWSYPPFGGIIRGGRIYGRGTADCKAGMVSMIYALLALKDKVDESKLRVELVFDGGEQDGSYSGMNLVLKQGLHTQAGIVGYAHSDFELPIAARGYRRYRITFHGASAHTGSRTKKGVNAIEAASEFIHAFKALDWDTHKTTLFPFGINSNFSLISGGDAINIVPDEASVSLDVRSVPGFTKEDVDTRIQQTVEKVEKKIEGLGIEVEYSLGEEAYTTDSKSPFVEALQASIRDVYDKAPPLVATGPAHIGNLLARHNIPVALWGPEGKNVHGYDEYVEIDSLPKTSLVYTKLIMNYFGL